MCKKINKQVSTIVQTVVDAKEQLAFYAETAIDLAVDNNLWENIPIVEHATKVLNIRDIYNKNKLKKNYLAFINAVSSMNTEEINTYKDILFSNTEESIETGETIFEIIIESTKPLKPQLIGNLSVALAKHQLSLEDYNQIALIIQSASIAALRALPSFLTSNNNTCHADKLGGIPEEGLLLSLGVAARYGKKFQIDNTGHKIAKYGFNINSVTF